MNFYKIVIALTISILWVNCIAPISATFDKIIYIIPPGGYENEKLFDMTDLIYNRDDCMRPFFNLREKLRSIGYDLKTTTLEHTKLEKCAGIIVCGIPHNIKKINELKKQTDCKIILVLLEPPTVAPHYYDRNFHISFDKVFTMLDDEVDNKKYFKLFYPQSTLKMMHHLIPFEEKKFCTMIASNKSSSHVNEQYSERKKIINFFEKNAPEQFEFYGHEWPKSHCYKGIAFSKLEILKQYKFCICYENTKFINGYITEKIFDSFLAGCVPIYKGAPNINSFIDKNCFIDRNKFETDQDLFQFLLGMTVQQYNDYIINIEKYLRSQQAFLFSADYFIYTMLRALIDNIDSLLLLHNEQISYKE